MKDDLIEIEESGNHSFLKVFLTIFGIVLIIFIVLLIVLATMKTYNDKNGCIEHSHIEQVACKKCIEQGAKYCTSYIDSTCDVEVYDEGYEYCERG